MNSRLVGSVLVLAAVAGLTACGSSSKDSSITTSTTVASSSASSTTRASGTTTTTEAAPGPVQTLSATITDTVFDDRVTVVAMQRHVEEPMTDPTLADDRELVLLKLSVSKGNLYTGGFTTSSLRLTGTGTEGTNNRDVSITPSLAPILAAAGTALPQTIDRGTSAEGWVLMKIDDTQTATDLKLQYTRKEVKLLGSSEMLPAFTAEVPLG